MFAIASGKTGAKYDALAAAIEAVRLAPQLPSAVYTPASSQLAVGQLTEASTTAERVRALAPNWNLSHQLLCRVALKQKAWSKAEQHAKRALELDPLSAIDWNSLGIAYQGRREPLEAAKTYVKALDLDPTMTYAQTNLKRVVMPMTTVTTTRVVRAFLLLPLFMPTSLYFSLVLRRKLPKTVQAEFLATPLKPLEALMIVVAFGLSAA
ncbi:MAG: hypothetical protein WAL84_02875, partial [Candidatus Dormiibacterota bacterium]